LSVQTTLTSLSRAAASNGPDGSTDAPSTLDDQLRYHGQFIAEVRDGAHLYASSISGTNTITGTISTSPTAYVTGQVYRFVAAGANTGAVTLNLNSIGAKAITKNGTVALAGGEIISGQAVEVIYDGTQFQLLDRIGPVMGTAQTTTSGTAKDFTSIPPWVSEIAVSLVGVSTNGTSNYLLQLGTSSGVETSGYLGAGSLGGGTPTVSNFTAGFGVASGLASNVVHGTIALTRVDGNIWACFGVLAASSSAGVGVVAGSKALTGTLDRVRLTTVNGTDVFDAGSVNITFK
jgi:hypothetical protein